MGNGLIFIGVPRERWHFPEFKDNLDQMRGNLQQAGVYCGIGEQAGHRVDMNRDELVNYFLTQHPRQPEWLYMPDSDMIHPADAPLRLARWGVPLVGGLYFYRHQSFQPQVFYFVPAAARKPDQWGRLHYGWGSMRDQIYRWLANHEIPRQDGPITIDDVDDGLLELPARGAVGGGAMLIHRSVLEAMTPPWFEYPHGWSSEDLEFCKRVWDEQGVRMCCDLTTISGHLRLVPVSVGHFMHAFENDIYVEQ